MLKINIFEQICPEDQLNYSIRLVGSNQRINEREQEDYRKEAHNYYYYL